MKSGKHCGVNTWCVVHADRKRVWSLLHLVDKAALQFCLSRYGCDAVDPVHASEGNCTDGLSVNV